MHVVVEERTGVLVVRAWVEGDAPAVLRARMTWTFDLADREPTTKAYAGVDAIEAAAKAWLDEFMARAGVPAGGEGVR